MSYPDLPVSAQRDEIAEAIRENQVVIVAGETGSGKTTQLPKICLEVGRGIGGMIGHTQPRRLAARAVAERIADELGQKVSREVGDIIGYQVRFTDEVGPTTLVKLMTDGILLAEMGGDPNLSRYDTIIVDEAHERSLNIDFILGYLGRLLPKRPDLKVIITSATIDSERFQKHFEGLIGAPVPVIEVSGRTYPVEVRYRPLVADTPSDGTGGNPDAPAMEAQPLGTMLHSEDSPGEYGEQGYGLGETLDIETALTHAVDELLTETRGDILVFLPGERDILDARDALAEHLGPRYVSDPKKPHHPNGVEILPLFARLSGAEQHRIYAPHSLQRIILATNIAETSLTVPGIRYVIDAGLARISRFSNKTKVQRLPIEAVSKASAGQRAGRAGRTSPGIAIRLYSERDYASRENFTEPEILRTSLASVILQMKALGLGDVKDFPFLDAPAPRAVRDGVALLVEIGALAPDGNITRLGRTLARLPIDPRLGRMLIEADRMGCASEVLIIVAALSIQDPRERPLENQEAADTAHARYADRRSDFITYLNMWRYLNVRSRDLSGSAFRRMCRREYFHYMRFREWRDIVRQLQQMCREVGIKVHPISLPSPRYISQFEGEADPDTKAAVEFGLGSNAVDADHIHMSILSGLLSNIGNWDEPKRLYAGTRGSKFTIWPGSALKNRKPKWVMAAELVETSRLFARTVGAIEPAWVEKYARDLVKRSYSSPIWSRAYGAGQVTEKVTLYGLTLVADRKVPLTRLGDSDLGEGIAKSGSIDNPALALAISAGAGGTVRLTGNVLAREMFIENALVLGNWRENYHGFTKHNRVVMQRAEEMAERMRDPALVPDEAARYRFFDSRIPHHVTSAATFNMWWKGVRLKTPDLLNYTLSDLVPQTETLDEGNFPSVWSQGDLRLPLSYSFDPGGERDGITVSVPLEMLGQVENEGFDWLVPGMAEEKVVAMIRGLPKAKRRFLAPATQTSQQVLEYFKQKKSDESAPRPERGVPSEADSGSSEEGDADPYSLEASLDRLRAWGSSGTVRTNAQRQVSPRKAQKKQQASSGGKLSPSVKQSKTERTPSFEVAFADAVRALKGVDLTEEDLATARTALPRHLHIGFQAVDDRGAILGYDQSLPLLQKRLAERAASSVQTAVQAALREAETAAKPQQPAPTNPDAPLTGLFEGLTVDTLPGFPNQPLPKVVEAQGPSGLLVRGYPALASKGEVRVGGQVSLKILPSRDTADHSFGDGLTQLLLADLTLEVGRVSSRWTGREALLLAGAPYGSTAELVNDAQVAAMRSLVLEMTRGAPSHVRSLAQYESLRRGVQDQFEDRVYQTLKGVVDAVGAYSAYQSALDSRTHSAYQKTRSETKRTADALFFDGYLSSLPSALLPGLPRYLNALAYRLERAGRGRAELLADRELSTQIRAIEERYEGVHSRVSARPFSASVNAEMEQVRLLIEELRVSLFAQSLGVAARVSPSRVLRRLETVEHAGGRNK